MWSSKLWGASAVHGILLGAGAGSRRILGLSRDLARYPGRLRRIADFGRAVALEERRADYLPRYAYS